MLINAACKRINAIESLVITKYWFKMTNAADAPILQLQLYRDLLAIQPFFPSAVEAVIKRLQCHLYFVSEEMTPLALASPRLSEEERAALVTVIVISMLPTPNSMH